MPKVNRCVTIVDSQSTKTTEKAEIRGFDAGKSEYDEIAFGGGALSGNSKIGMGCLAPKNGAKRTVSSDESPLWRRCLWRKSDTNF